MIDPGRLLARDFASMLLDIVPDAPCNDDTFACLRCAWSSTTWFR
jgi:hypothetical protein